MSTFNFQSNNEGETNALAMKLASVLQKGDIVLLKGDLAAGKTHFVKGVAEEIGYDRNSVNSPTFNIANFYETDQTTLLHIDLYRIKTLDEFNDLGLYDYFEESIVCIEWGGLVKEILEEYLLVTFELVGEATDKREISFSYFGNTFPSRIKAVLKQ